MRTAIFVYDFPHWKSQQILLTMTAKGYRPEVAISFAPKEIYVPDSLIKPKHVGVLHPREICSALGILYDEPMEMSEMVNQLKWANIDVGLVGGARILPRPVWESCKKGIINVHPGLIPEARGLDCIRWSVYHNIPLGVSAHYIDERVDAGRVILRKPIPLYKGDCWLSIRTRLDETQIEIIPDVLKLVENVPIDAFPIVETSSKAFQYMPEELVSQLDLESYIRRYSV